MYILDFCKEVVLSYLLSSGYIGTYEPSYKLLYNKREKLFFEQEGERELRRVKQEALLSNEMIENRRKFLKNFLEREVECRPYVSTARIVYLQRTFEVKQDSLILFKLSNGSFQIHELGSENHLLVTDKELHLFTVRKGVQLAKLTEKREKIAECKQKVLVNLYLKFKKIHQQITSKK